MLRLYTSHRNVPKEKTILYYNGSIFDAYNRRSGKFDRACLDYIERHELAAPHEKYEALKSKRGLLLYSDISLSVKTLLNIYSVKKPGQVIVNVTECHSSVMRDIINLAEKRGVSLLLEHGDVPEFTDRPIMINDEICLKAGDSFKPAYNRLLSGSTSCAAGEITRSSLWFPAIRWGGAYPPYRHYNIELPGRICQLWWDDIFLTRAFTKDYDHFQISCNTVSRSKKWSEINDTVSFWNARYNINENSVKWIIETIQNPENKDKLIIFGDADLYLSQIPDLIHYINNDAEHQYIICGKSFTGLMIPQNCRGVLKISKDREVIADYSEPSEAAEW